MKRVEAYDTQWLVSKTTFPVLNEARFQHACSHYIDNRFQVVSKYIKAQVPRKRMCANILLKIYIDVV